MYIFLSLFKRTYFVQFYWYHPIQCEKNWKERKNWIALLEKRQKRHLGEKTMRGCVRGSWSGRGRRYRRSERYTRGASIEAVSHPESRRLGQFWNVMWPPSRGHLSCSASVDVAPRDITFCPERAERAERAGRKESVWCAKDGKLT